jgi:hypothetical protein
MSLSSARLEEVAGVLTDVVRVIELEDEVLVLPDVEVVGAPVAVEAAHPETVVGKLAVVDGEGARVVARDGAGEDAVLVVMNVAVRDDDPVRLDAEPGPVLAIRRRDGRAGELEVLDDHVVGADGVDALLVRRRVAGDVDHRAPAHALQVQAGRVDVARVVVGARRDVDLVVGLRRGDRGAGGGVHLSGADGERRGAGGGGDEEGRERHGGKQAGPHGSSWRRPDA